VKWQRYERAVRAYGAGSAAKEGLFAVIGVVLGWACADLPAQERLR
jgi:hypothetical protein